MLERTSASCSYDAMRFTNNSRLSRWLLVPTTALTLALSVTACKKDEASGKPVDTKSELATAKAPQKGTIASVTPEGTKFDPALTKDQVPEGAWMCDMGSVHYAASDKGDGQCRVCSMDLVQKSAEPAKPEPAGAVEGEEAPGEEPSEDHADHAH